VETVIQDFDRNHVPFSEHQVQQALTQARASLHEPSESENRGAWAEVLAFSLLDTRLTSSPWGTYFAPMGSGTDQEGKAFYFPDIAGADQSVVEHWSARAKTLTNSILVARYADLSWDLCTVIADIRRDPEMARLAIDAYLTSLAPSIRTERHDRFIAVLRALDLATMIRDPERTNQARLALLEIHREVMTSHEAQWWYAYDRLIDETRAGVTDEERQQLVADLEEIVRYFGDTTEQQKFNPHVVEDAAKRLIRHYTRAHSRDDVRRLYETIARAFEHFAGLGSAMLASAVLQTAVNAYRDAGMPEESKRVRMLMEDKIGQSREEMGTVGTEFKISFDDMETFLTAMVVEELGSTFVRLAANFLPKRRELELQIRQIAEKAPLQAHIPFKIMADDHVAAVIGSIDDDPFGRLIHQTTITFSLSSVWLQASLDRAVEKHSLTVEHFVGWANRHGLFDDLTFLIEGVRAWSEGDLAKATHILVPQVERGLRSIVSALGKPVTKPHGTVAGVSIAIGIGDILYSADVTEALGPDLTLYFLALFADPRGDNLRNRVAHGLISPNSVDLNKVNLLIHTLLVFGVWKEFAESRR
jgi:lysyl-tRNA synthetase class 1